MSSKVSYELWEFDFPIRLTSHTTVIHVGNLGQFRSWVNDQPCLTGWLLRNITGRFCWFCCVLFLAVVYKPAGASEDMFGDNKQNICASVSQRHYMLEKLMCVCLDLKAYLTLVVKKLESVHKHISDVCTWWSHSPDCSSTGWNELQVELIRIVQQTKSAVS